MEMKLEKYLEIHRRYDSLDNIKALDIVSWTRLLECLPLLDGIAEIESKNVSNAFLTANLIPFISHKATKPDIATGSAERAIEKWRAELQHDGLTDDGWMAITRSAAPLDTFAKRLSNRRTVAISVANGLGVDERFRRRRKLSYFTRKSAQRRNMTP